MKTLALEDLKDMDRKALIEHIIKEYECEPEEVKKFDILIAYECEESYEGSSWFLLRDRDTKKLYENHAGHCSCYGFEGQWGPDETTLAYLKSDKFYVYLYSDEDKAAVKDFIKRLRN